MFALILTTTPSKEIARKIIKGLLKEKLIACANISGPVESHFIWKGKANREKEYHVLIKSRRSRYRDIEKYIVSQHPYDVPEVILIPIKEGFEKYLRWIGDVVGY